MAAPVLPDRNCPRCGQSEADCTAYGTQPPCEPTEADFVIGHGYAVDRITGQIQIEVHERLVEFFGPSNFVRSIRPISLLEFEEAIRLADAVHAEIETFAPTNRDRTMRLFVPFFARLQAAISVAALIQNGALAPAQGEPCASCERCERWTWNHPTPPKAVGQPWRLLCDECRADDESRETPAARRRSGLPRRSATEAPR